MKKKEIEELKKLINDLVKYHRDSKTTCFGTYEKICKTRRHFNKDKSCKICYRIHKLNKED